MQDPADRGAELGSSSVGEFGVAVSLRDAWDCNRAHGPSLNALIVIKNYRSKP
jgi:hypothetical protein